MRKQPLPGKAALLCAAILCALAASSTATAPAADFWWEYPTPLADGQERYPSAFASGGGITAIWQESEKAVDGSGRIFLTMARLSGGSVRVTGKRFAGPFTFRDAEPPAYSAAISAKGEIAIAAAASETEIVIRTTNDSGATFRSQSVPITIATAGTATAGTAEGSGMTMISPRIFPRRGGGWYLFISLSRGEQFLSSYISRTDGNGSWTPFDPLTTEAEGLRMSFLPSVETWGVRDFVLFQSRIPMGPTGDLVDQLFSKYSDDRGATWSTAAAVTKDLSDPGANAATLYNNQRPHFALAGGRMWLAWERAWQGGVPRIWSAELARDGTVVKGTAEAVSPGNVAAYEPRVFDLAGKPAVVWFDKISDRERVSWTGIGGALANPIVLSRPNENASFARPVYSSGKLWAFWQSRHGEGSGIMVLAPDTSVPSPAIQAANFVPGERTRRNAIAFRWTRPDDSSGIRGYSWLLSRDPNAVPPETPNAGADENAAAGVADADGLWYASVRAVDYAGNWSAASRLEFYRDTTPPSPPVPGAPAAGADGFLSSNSFALSWKHADDPEEIVSGYAWELRRIGPLDRLPARKRPKTEPMATGATVTTVAEPTYDFSPVTDYERTLVAAAGDAGPAPILRSAAGTASFSNVDDGYYLFLVSAIDSVGNVGSPARVLLRADKFVPYTAITDVRSVRDDFGKVTLTVTGRGFREDGLVTRIVVDRDGAEPYDAGLSLDRGEYSITGDRLIEGIALPDLEKASYRVGVFHERRGWLFTGAVLTVDESGNVKFGDYGKKTATAWSSRSAGRWIISPFDAFAWLAFAFAAAGLALSLRAAFGTVREAESIRLEAAALLEGRPMPTEEKKTVARTLKRRQGGLVIKFTLTISFLVIFVVALLAVPLGLNFIGTQRITLATGLEERARVLLEGVAAGARATTFSGDLKTTLGELASQSRAMGAEANYITVTGMESGTANPDVVWSSNDPRINDKIDRKPFDSSTQGVAVLSDKLGAAVLGLQARIDRRIATEQGTLWSEIKDHQANAAALIGKNDPASQARFRQENESAIAKERRFRTELDRIADEEVASLPVFDSVNTPSTPSDFLFYKPVLYTVRGQDVFFRGLVRLEVNTKGIVDKIAASRDTLLGLILVIALAALGLGIAGAVVLASIIVRPINLIVKKVEEIRDTYKKEKLEGFTIGTRTGDELQGLAETIVEMTRGLVHGAKDNADLLAGEQDQRELLPLESGKGGRSKKLAIAKLDKKDVEFFGYYKGAKLVSGDYLDYLDLDGRHFAFIKCDVSGKGVSAAMIMAVVASVFKRHFEGWTVAKPGFDLTKLSYTINATLNVCDFRGKFAAFTVGILDSSTGKTWLCNAGDSVYRAYEASKGRMATLRMPGDAPAAGPLANFMIEMKSPFTQAVHELARGDILVLFTDGIDEARRYWRDPQFRKIRKQDADGTAEETPTKRNPSSDNNPDKEYVFEDFGNDRAAAVIEAVMNRGTFELVKDHNPVADEKLSFDFRGCAGTLEEVGMALVTVEKIFRLYRHPDAGPSDTVKVDSLIDGFLQDHFDQYRLYCGAQAPNPEEFDEAEEGRKKAPGKKTGRRAAVEDAGGEFSLDRQAPMYLLYTGVMEDEQYDDITVLLVRRK
ncbi:MAG: SpoIIE family protein phosphatase [Spirochaetes bacterium]|nr:SpoIIE family protein phosphatase [Spirochaetota bacterium]